jgi:twitching motility protein PilT
VPQTTVLIDKLLATVIQLNASDLHIAVGQPPVVRHHGRLRRLDTKVLDSDDTTALMKAIAPDRCSKSCKRKAGRTSPLPMAASVSGWRFSSRRAMWEWCCG